MITQYNVQSLLQEELPQLTLKPCFSDISLEVYTSINHFTDYTRHALEHHHFSITKRCFAVAENLYINGDKTVRFLIENRFVYSFSSNKPHNHADELIMKSVMPKKLYTIYRNQLLQKGN